MYNVPVGKTKLVFMLKYISLFLFFLMGINVNLKAQISENFNDGDFTSNPAWNGATSDFIVNNSLQLQSSNTTENSSFWLATPNSIATSAQWEMFVQIDFNPSSLNYIDVYLIASDSYLTHNSTTGYFVRIGNTDDEISFYRKDANGSIIKIIDGLNGILNSSNSIMKIKVTRDETNKWTLYRDMSGSGNFYSAEGSVTDAAYLAPGFFGLLIKQSTSSFFKKHFFDDIEIKYYVPDNDPPLIHSANAISASEVDVYFNEPVEAESSQDTNHYSVNNNLGNPVSAIRDAINPSLVHLTFSTSFANSVDYTLTINGVKDFSGNEINSAAINFSYYSPLQYDVVIDELMIDPTPGVGLPDCEWIELRNTSSFPINLRGWKLADLSGLSGPIPDCILQPDSFVIVCTTSSVPLLNAFGKAISVTSFPSLDNNGDLISLISSNGKTIHAVQYAPDWYQNELKREGGWTLEMIDSKNPCSGISNWKASEDISGGTPGKLNSIAAINTDETGPGLLRAFASNSTTITLLFDEPLDSLKAASINNYTIDNGLSVLSSTADAPLFNKVNIVLSSSISQGKIYTISASNITDCIGNVIGQRNNARFGIAQDADNNDIVINEILYNPKPQGVDFVELYNRSQKIIDLNRVYIANRNSTNIVSNIQQVSSESLLLFPGDFIVLSEDPVAVKREYITTNPDAFITINDMPSFPNDKGNVIILNIQGSIIDEVKYADSWQFPLVSNTEGVSLERIDYDAPSQQSNFHSAATSAGYGTPGYKNSQYRIDELIQGEIKVTPDIFSPDNDGTDDFTAIHYNFPSPGYVANITIFDASGRPVRYLQRNALSGTRGYYRWDGLDDKKGKLPQGIYIIYTEIFNTDGKKRQFKNVVVLARRY
jgi:hypothetical protein